MHWIAPSEKDADNAALEKRLWDAPSKCEVRNPECEVQSIRPLSFVLGHLHRLSIHGVEKTDETGHLCRLNLAVHGLEGEIKHGGNINSYYDDPHDTTGRFDFVLANPPFNVNAVDILVRGRRNRKLESISQASTDLISQSPSRHI